MGTKFTDQSASNYNATPPADDGSVAESNRITWAKIKTKIGDPVKALADAISDALVVAFDYGPNSVSTNYTTVAGDHDKTVQMTAAGTITLLAAATGGAGYTVNISNQHSAAITIGRSGADTIQGAAADYTLQAGHHITLRVNAGATGYLIIGGDTASKTIGGNLTVNGNTVLGDAAADTITMNAKSPSSPNMAAFVARRGSAAADATGDGTAFTIPFDTELFDNGNDYNNSTGALTAPATRNYMLFANVTLSQLAAGHTSGVAYFEVSDGRTYNFFGGNFAAMRDASNELAFSGCAVINMTAADTVKVVVQVSGATKVVDVATTVSRFGGFVVG